MVQDKLLNLCQSKGLSKTTLLANFTKTKIFLKKKYIQEACTTAENRKKIFALMFSKEKIREDHI